MSDNNFSMDDISVRSENGCFYVKPAQNDIVLVMDGRKSGTSSWLRTKEHPERGIRGSLENPIERLVVQNDRLMAVLLDGAVYDTYIPLNHVIWPVEDGWSSIKCINRISLSVYPCAEGLEDKFVELVRQLPKLKKKDKEEIKLANEALKQALSLKWYHAAVALVEAGADMNYTTTQNGHNSAIYRCVQDSDAESLNVMLNSGQELPSKDLLLYAFMFKCKSDRDSWIPSESGLVTGIRRSDNSDDAATWNLLEQVGLCKEDMLKFLKARTMPFSEMDDRLAVFLRNYLKEELEADVDLSANFVLCVMECGEAATVSECLETLLTPAVKEKLVKQWKQWKSVLFEFAAIGINPAAYQTLSASFGKPTKGVATKCLKRLGSRNLFDWTNAKHRELLADLLACGANPGNASRINDDMTGWNVVSYLSATLGPESEPLVAEMISRALEKNALTPAGKVMLLKELCIGNLVGCAEMLLKSDFGYENVFGEVVCNRETYYIKSADMLAVVLAGIKPELQKMYPCFYGEALPENSFARGNVELHICTLLQRYNKYDYLCVLMEAFPGLISMQPELCKMVAVFRDDAELLQKLMDSGVEMKRMKRIICNSFELIEAILPNTTDKWQWRADESLLHLVSAAGKKSCLKFLLENGEKPDQLLMYGKNQKLTPLFLAVLHGHVECVKLLLDAGANVSNSKLQLDTKYIICPNLSDCWGSSRWNQHPDRAILYAACLSGKLELLKLLEESGCSIPLDDGLLADCCSMEMQKHFLGKGMDLSNTWDLLADVAYKGNLSDLRFFLEHFGAFNAKQLRRASGSLGAFVCNQFYEGMWVKLEKLKLLFDYAGRFSAQERSELAGSFLERLVWMEPGVMYDRLSENDQMHLVEFARELLAAAPDKRDINDVLQQATRPRVRRELLINVLREAL